MKTLISAAAIAILIALPAAAGPLGDQALVSIFNPEPGISQFWRDEMAKDHGTPSVSCTYWTCEPDGNGFHGVCRHTYCFDDGSELPQAWLDYQNAGYDPADHPGEDDLWRPYQPWVKGDII